MKNYDIDIERSIIGCLMRFEELREKASLIVSEDFYIAQHKDIFNIVKSFCETGSEHDLITVTANADENMKFEILQCGQFAISASLFDEHLRIFKAMASQRRIINGFNDLVSKDDCSIHNVQKLIDDESQKQLTTNIEKINKKNISSFVAELNEEKEVIKTGFNTVDTTLGGIRKGTVFIIGARPSTGKTTLALNIACNQSSYNKKVLFFSLEMSAEMIYERMNAAKFQIDYGSFNKNKLTADEIKKVTDGMQMLQEQNNFFVFDDVYNAELISNLIVENKPDLVVVDYMQSISTISKFENTRTRIDYISSLLKRTAKSTGCTIIILSQITRSGKEAPTMSDLKESGGLEQDGDYIALLHRPFVLNKNDGSIMPEQTELLLDKNKFGGTGKVDLRFDLQHQKFYEVDKWRESQIDYSGTPFDEGIEI